MGKSYHHFLPGQSLFEQNLLNVVWVTLLPDVPPQMKVYSVVRQSGDPISNALISYSKALELTYESNCASTGKYVLLLVKPHILSLCLREGMNSMR